MVGEINFSILDQNAPLKTAQAWDIPGAYTEGMANALARKQAQQTQQINALALQKAQRDMADEESVRNALANSGGDWDAAGKAMMEGGQYKQAIDLKTKLQDQKTKQIAQQVEALKLVKSAADFVFANPTPENAVATLQQLTQRTGQDFSGEIAAVQNMDPEQIQKWAAGHSLTAKDMMLKNEKMDLGGTSNLISVDPVTGKVVGQQVFNKTASPDAILSSNTAMRGQNMADARKREELNGAETGFTPEAISAAAARYNIDGTLPPMGMGKAGVAVRGKILNEAAKIQSDSGISPEEQRIRQIGNTASATSLKKLQTQENMVGSFERNFNRNADIVLEQSNKVDRTGIPLVNKWIQAGKRAGTSDPELKAYDVAVKAVSNEYAKIVSGSMGNTAMAESEIRKMEGLLNAAQTPEDVKGVLAMMKRDTANRMKGFAEEKAALIGGMRSNPKAKQSDVPTPTVSNW